MKEFLNQELEVAQAGANIKESSLAKRLGKILTTAVFSFSILLSLFAVTFTIMIFISEVDGPSMMTTLNASFPENRGVRDCAVVNRYATPKPGDVIVVKHRWKTRVYDLNGNLVETQYLIKRLIATEGDRIRFNQYNEGTPDEHYKTVVNGIEIDEPYLDQDHWGKMLYYGQDIYNYIQKGEKPISAPTYFVPFYDHVELNPTKDTTSPDYGKYELVLRPGEIFYMGDNRGSDVKNDFNSFHSIDCTTFGPGQFDTIQGVMIDQMYDGENFSDYLWRKLKQFFSFSWLF